ncbi:MAG: sorbosone dehydrogenase family protein, partial [Arenimonas sp.]
VGEHGSWNRTDPVGYKVVFVPFRDGKPAGDPIDVITGFHEDGGKTFGRPVGVTVDPGGALIVADDLSNTIWRVTPKQKVAIPVPVPAVDPAASAQPDSGQ